MLMEAVVHGVCLVESWLLTNTDSKNVGLRVNELLILIERWNKCSQPNIFINNTRVEIWNILTYMMCV